MNIASKLIAVAVVFSIACNNEKKQYDTTESAAQTPDSRTHVADTNTIVATYSQHQPANEPPRENPYANSKIEIRVFANDTVRGSKIKGFGYDVYIDDKLYVHQPHVPAVSGNNGFNSKENARKAGEFIIYKIKNNIMPPSVSAKELDSLGVLK